MNNAEALLILSNFPNDLWARLALRRNNTDLFCRVIAAWFGGEPPLVYEILLTRCAEHAKHYVAWRHDPTDFLQQCLEEECRLLYARSKMTSSPSCECKLTEMPTRKDQEEMDQSQLDDLLKIREEVCKKLGHHFFRTDYIYARDENKVAFKGDGFKKAAKYTTVFCSSCMLVAEIEICPTIEVRPENRPMVKPAAA